MSNPNQPRNIDKWNDRLDDNLEPKQEGDIFADEKAEEFSEEEGTLNLRKSPSKQQETSEDNMAINQPKPGSPKPGEIEREE